MAGIYAADIYCDDCVEDTKNDIYYDRVDDLRKLSRDEWERVRGFDDEGNYDSDEYPKYCSDTEESDTPSHCAECDVFLENNLTMDGYDYVADAIQHDLDDGHFGSTAITIWSDFYGIGVVIEVDARADECSKLEETLSEYCTIYKVVRG